MAQQGTKSLGGRVHGRKTYERRAESASLTRDGQSREKEANEGFDDALKTRHPHFAGARGSWRGGER